MAELTPMMKQYFEIKEKCRDYILFYRLGDFYEMFYDDARLVSRELEPTLIISSSEKKTLTMFVQMMSRADILQASTLLKRAIRSRSASRSRTPSRPRGWSNARSSA